MASFAGTFPRYAAMAVLASLVIAGLCPASATASAQASDATLNSSVMLVMQGNTNLASGVEGRNDFYALKILTFDLPYDVSRVYTTVPFAAHNVTVWSGTNTFGPSQFGNETVGAHSGQLFVDVPSSHPRTSNYTIAASSLSDFTATGTVLSNLNYSDGALRLVNESDVGTYISPDVSIASAASVRSMLMSINGNSTGNITSHASTDGGLTWWSIENSTWLNVTSSGTTLKVMFELTGNTSLGFNTSLSSFQLTATYVQLVTLFSVHVSYLWTSEFVDGRMTVDLSEALPFSANGSYMIMLYTLIGYDATGGGFQLELDANRSMNSYDDKDLYLGTMSPVGTASYTAEIVAPKSSNNMAVFSVILVLALALAGAFVFMNSRKKRYQTREEPKAIASPKDRAPAHDEARRRELVDRKKAMLAEIEGIRKKLAANEITQAAASAELSRIKKDFKAVRNELNRLSRKGTPSALEIQPNAGYESVLGALARIDEDYEKGRLPENAYKTIRKEYVEKAAAIMATQTTAVREPQSPQDLEKNKLMEAIISLDEERNKGEIDEKVYSDLRASYRKQLADLMRKAEGPAKEEDL